MTTTVEGVLRDLQSAVTAKQLYPSGHPRFAFLLDRLERGVAALTATHPEFSVFAVDGRVASEGAILPRGESLACGLFSTLRANGFHRLTIRRGASRQEFECFAAQVARSSQPGAAGAGLGSTEHLRLSALEAVSAEKSFAVLDVLGRTTLPLNEVWTDIGSRNEVDPEVLEHMGLALLRTLETESGAILPLASLRSHDDYTVTHITNVAMLSMALAEVIGLSREAVHAVGVAALLHDIGKLNVPVAVLKAPGKLDDEELAIVRRHPEEGARILLQTPGVPELAVAVAYEHHVQFNGGGYPVLPQGWRVNLASRITQVADVYDALRSNRPYRAALERDRVYELMSRDAGTVFHPELVRAFFDRVIPRTIEAG